MQEKIKTFWMKKNLALFGLSRKEKSVSREIYQLLTMKNYLIFPINPNTETIDSIVCYKSLDDVKMKLDGAIIITNPKISHDVVRICQQKGISDLWFQYDTMDDALRAYCATPTESIMSIPALCCIIRNPVFRIAGIDFFIGCS